MKAPRRLLGRLPASRRVREGSQERSTVAELEVVVGIEVRVEEDIEVRVGVLTDAEVEVGVEVSLSWVLAFALAIPLTAWLDVLIGKLGFVAPLPYILAPGALAAWAILVWIVSLFATLIPASRAARTSIATALTQV